MKPSVFISSSIENIEEASVLKYLLESDAETTLWTQSTFLPGTTKIESITEVAKQNDFAIFIISEDFLTGSRRNSEVLPKQNLIFEIGFFVGTLGSSRTFLLVDKRSDIKIPSDLSGLCYYNR